MLSRKYSTEEISETLNKLIDQNFIREEEYKRQRIKGLLLKGFASLYIIRKLEQENLNTSETEIDEVRAEQQIVKSECIEALIQKKMRGKVIPSNYESKMKLKSKIMNFLASKGYSYEQAQQALPKELN